MQDYHKQQLKEFKVHLKHELAIHKRILQADLNQKMLENIKFAEAKIERDLQTYTKLYEQSMDKLIEKRNSGNLRPHLFDFQAKIHKKKFENDLQTTKDTWMDFINNCRANIE